MTHSHETLTLDHVQSLLDMITDTLLTCEAHAMSDSVQVQLRRENDYIYAGRQLEKIIGEMPDDHKILFTVGDEPVWASSFTRGAYDFLSESTYKLGDEERVGPRDSLVISETKWYYDTIDQARVPNFGNGWLELTVTGLAKALNSNALLSVAPTQLADAADYRL